MSKEKRKLSEIDVLLATALKDIKVDTEKQGQVVFTVFPYEETTIIKPVLIDENNHIEPVAVFVKGTWRKDFALSELAELLLGKHISLLSSFMPLLDMIPKMKQ